MTDKLLFITDTYKDLNLKKDTSILMIEEALKNNFLVYQCELSDLFLDQQNSKMQNDPDQLLMQNSCLRYLNWVALHSRICFLHAVYTAP